MLAVGLKIIHFENHLQEGGESVMQLVLANHSFDGLDPLLLGDVGVKGSDIKSRQDG